MNIILRTSLEELVYRQSATKIKTDKFTVGSFSNNNIKRRKSHSMETMFEAQDKVNQPIRYILKVRLKD